tara:strand:- start:1536 stop:1958 length:423 start_codon:yes stop_codon:yes gene_type:complete
MVEEEQNVRRGRLNKSRSKNIEREWAKRFGTRRLDAIAGSGSRQSDLRFESSRVGLVFDIEVKSRIRPSIALYEEAVKKAEFGSVPVLGLEVRTPAGHANPRYVILSREDFCQIVGAVAEDDQHRTPIDTENRQQTERLI